MCNASLMVAMAVWMSLCSKVMVACITRMLLYPRAWYMLSLHLRTAAVINNRELRLQQTLEKARGVTKQREVTTAVVTMV